eukprot:TRINITY_DN3859_c0_g1_i1.p1 TRINITY_DN3859_c0_g1~~TRINITY_DN3859_c0_g1_i1.p1  ORF type:complete len:448 (+),score=139.85 TRINITY_DN3859_c0_g1_i1:83-1345(+)
MAVSHKIKIFMGKVVPMSIPIPEVVTGNGCVDRMGEIVKQLGVKKPLIVTDEILVKIGHVSRVEKALEKEGLSGVVFSKVVPNPPSGLVLDGEKVYLAEQCDSLIALGGGSPMDCCKMIGARIANPKEMAEYEGFGKVSPIPGWRKLPPLIAIPTTAGTGSETTVAAVISFTEQRRKAAMSDPALVPVVAVLDPSITVGLPPDVTAATGVDALTHAVESFVSQWATDYTKRFALRAVERIFKNLTTCYHNGSVLSAREEMLRASFEAGVSFTRAAVGYVHAIAHQLGGLYGTPHGVANAMILPHVIELYIKHDACTDQLAALALAAGLGSHYEEYEAKEKKELAVKFLEAVRALNSEMGIPTSVPKMTKDDVKVIADRALAEAHGLQFASDLGYPVPCHFEQEETEDLVRRLLPKQDAKL